MRRLYDGRARRVGWWCWVAPDREAPALTDESRSMAATFDGVADRVLTGVQRGPFDAAMAVAVRAIVASEARALAVPKPDGSLAGGIAMRARAKAIAGFQASGAAAVAAWGDELAALMRRIGGAVPRPRQNIAVRIAMPAIELMADADALLDEIVRACLAWASEGAAVRPGSAVAAIVKENLLTVSGLTEEEARRRPARLVLPSAMKGTVEAKVAAYLKGTPLAALLRTPMPWGITEKDLFESGVLLAKTGHGKSQSAEFIGSGWLELNGRSLVMMDSQGDMLERIGRLKVFAPGGRLADRLVWITPRELDAPVAIGLFQLSKRRMAALSPVDREAVTNKIIDLLEGIFSTLLGAGLTQRQALLERSLARLMISIPGATLLTLRDVLREPAAFSREIGALGGMAGEFLAGEFSSPHYRSTRSEVLRRVWGALEDDALRRMLCAPETRLDIGEALDRGAVILVDTAKAHLGAARSAMFGKFVLMLVQRAIWERASQPESARRPTLVIVDEASEYVVDGLIDQFIVQARKYKAGCLFSVQHMDQMPVGLRNVVSGQLGVKLVGRVSARDAGVLAPDMHVSPELLTELERRERSSEWALYVANATRRAAKIELPLGALNSWPRMSEAEWQQVLERNRARYGVRASPPPRPRPGPPPVKDDGDGPSWRS